jgi:DNA-binding FrmR family transcriptional regulator
MSTGNFIMNTRLYSKEPTKSKIIHRLKITRGHIEKVIKMVEENAYCINIINQSQAIQSALKKVDEMILENHLKSCVIDPAKKGKIDENKLIKEIKAVFRKSAR